MRNEHYKVMSLRLSDEVIKELKLRRSQFKSWNLMFEQLLLFPAKSKQKIESNKELER